MWGGAISRAGLAFASLFACAALPLSAQDLPTDRLTVRGDVLVYDTTLKIDGKEFDIRYADVDAMRDMLRQNPGITSLEITSTGGGHYPAMDLAALVIDFGLDTHISDTCESSCVTVFLGGTKRTMAKGARIGFHQLSWNENSVQDYYNKHRVRRGWDTPFSFAEWMYKDTQTETYNRLTYMVRRGVDAQFAIQTLRKPDTSMWFPYRSVLKAAGVITE